MNIALSAIIIALLLLPGALFRLAYIRGNMKRTYASFSPLGEDLAAVLVANILIFPIALTILGFLDVKPTTDVLLPLLAGNFGKDGEFLKIAIKYWDNVPSKDVLGYVLIVLLAYLLGLIFHRIVRYLRLDTKFSYFRFANEWFYILESSVNKEDNQAPKVVAILAVDLKAETYLYRGEVQDWILDRTGQMERFILTSTERRKMTSDAIPSDGQESVWYPIKAKHMMIRYSDCRNIAIEYLYTAELSSSELQNLQNIAQTGNIEVTPTQNL
jgi:hypothetical protein